MIGAIVLAAGASSRMGQPKALLEVGGVPFLEMCLRTLQACPVGCVRVVLGNDAAAIRARVELRDEVVVLNPNPENGMLSSVRCGLRALPVGVDGFFLWPVDHAAATAATLGALLGAWRASGAPVAIPVVGDKRGHPVLFAGNLRAEIIAADDSIGVRQVVHAHAGDRIEVPVDDLGAIEDVDTPAELSRLSARMLG